jgi:hypothetical protein
MGMGDCSETVDASTTFKAEKHEFSIPNSISYDIKADFLRCVIIEAQLAEESRAAPDHLIEKR